MVKPCAFRQIAPWLCLFLATAGVDAGIKDDRGAADFKASIRPILEHYCFDCHGDGESKGKVAFDQFKSDQALLENRELWWKALKNVRAGIMPPAKKPRPTIQEQEKLAHWVKADVFYVDPQNPDPGRVTIRRLNREEYHNTIRDLLGMDYDTQANFPPDDTGYGFDTIGDVLTLPPMLLEKYLMAAEKIVGQAVPVVSRVMPEKIAWGKSFQGLGGEAGNKRGGGLALSYYKPASVSNTLAAQWPGKYKLAVDLMVNEHYVDNVFDYNKCRLIFQVDGRELLRQDYSWEGGRRYHYDFDQDLAAGDHLLAFQLQPLTPGQKQTRTLTLQITSVTLTGPTTREHWVLPASYSRFFPKDIPAGKKERRRYARELLGNFARKAFRRPVDDKTVDRLTDLAESAYSEPGKTFEAGMAQGMVAVLASPRFLFREESAEPGRAKDQRYPFVDEYSLASRLSYFLWSSMPDDELFRLAGEGRLRQNLSAQVERMLKDKRSEALVRDFTGQWLRGRDVESVPIDARSILTREEKVDDQRTHQRNRFHELNDRSYETLTKAEKDELAGLRTTLFKNARSPRVNFNGELRADMRRETEGVFDYVLREDRSVLELIDSDYTFLNHRLAMHYGITNVSGDEMRRVILPPDNPRGGVLTEGTVLVVTSNPTRTSPVKRGLFILDSILGTPPPPPPPNIPPLEDAAKGSTNHALSLRATLALHRKEPLCSSCHNRMDPLGLAFENFNAMGMWRQAEYGDPIDATGTLTTGESFATIKELKHILVTNHAKDFYRTLAEKMLTYAVGRGLDYYDVETVDEIVASLEASNGRASALLAGVVESAPFQKCRPASSFSAALPSGKPVTLNLTTP